MSQLHDFARAVAGAAVGVIGLTIASTAALAWPAETSRELAVREGPSQRFPHIQVIPPGSIVDVHHCTPERSWCKVDVHGTIGYVRAEFLQRIGDVYLGPTREYYTVYGPNVYIGIPGRPYYRGYYGPYRRW